MTFTAFHHERDENYEWSLDETGRVYVSAYDYEQSGSMSANGHRGGSGTYNYESSSYTQGNGWSSFYHSGSFGSSSFYDEYDFTADWSESFDGVTNSYSSAHSASNDVEGYEYNLSGYFSDYYNTWTGQSPDSGSYSDSYPSSNSYASTVTENGFSFTWNGWDVRTRQGVYIHNTPYSGIWDIPFGLGSWSNPVEQPNSAWSSEPETPEPYSSPSQRYVDDLDAFFYGYDNTDLYETGLQQYGTITVTNASGSASFSSAVDFYEDFRNDELGNEGQGSALTEVEKQTIVEAVAVTYNTSNVSTQSNSSSSRLSWWDLTCAYAAGFGSGLLQGGRNIANGVIGTVEEIKNTAIDVGHGTITAASLLVCDEPIVYEAQSQALRALESNQISTSRFYWRFGETVLTFGTNEQVRAAIQWWKGEITDDECSEIIGSTAFAQLIIARSGNAMGKGKPAPKPERPAEYINTRVPVQETVNMSTIQGVCFLADTIVYFSTFKESKFPLEITSSKPNNSVYGCIIIGFGIFMYCAKIPKKSDTRQKVAS